MADQKPPGTINEEVLGAKAARSQEHSSPLVQPDRPTRTDGHDQTDQTQTLQSYGRHKENWHVTAMPSALKSRFKHTLSNTPFLGKIVVALPRRALFTILAIAGVNAIVWIAVGIALHYNPSLASNALLAYTLGLRHALDADHIAAIDLVARRLSGVTGRIGVGSAPQNSRISQAEDGAPLAEEDSLLDLPSQKLKKPPMTIGLFFSLGHSTVVVITAIVTAATAAAVSKKFDRYSYVGGIIGTSVSTAFLILLSGINGYMLYRLVNQMRAVLAARRVGGPLEEDAARPLAEDNERGLSSNAVADPAANSDTAEGNRENVPEHLSVEGVGGGILFRIFRALFRFVDAPWKMYPLGFVFGLGFDTSSEIALLGLSAVQAARGTSIWLILIFPILFTAGMALLDTTDGALMMTLYIASSRSKNGTVTILYYSIVLTSLTVFVSAMIGIVQALNLAEAVGGYKGSFWDGLERLGEVWDIVGGAICGSFIVFGLLSVLLYKPWRRRYDPAYERE